MMGKTKRETKERIVDFTDVDVVNIIGLDTNVFSRALNQKILELKCPQCGSSNVVFGNDGYFVCRNCGFVMNASSALPMWLWKPIEHDVQRYLPQLDAYVSAFREVRLYYDEFVAWLFRCGIKILLRMAGQAVNKGQPYTYRVYARAQLHAGGWQTLRNLMAAWLVRCKGISIYKLWRQMKFVPGAESIYTWLRRMQPSDCICSNNKNS